VDTTRRGVVAFFDQDNSVWVKAPCYFGVSSYKAISHTGMFLARMDPVGRSLIFHILKCMCEKFSNEVANISRIIHLRDLQCLL
jgi:hypothetical protein